MSERDHPSKTFWCHLCVGGEGHCFGSGLSINQQADSDQLIKCDCPCKSHKLSEDDVRNDMIALLTAEAHDDYDLLKSLISELPEERTHVLLVLMTKYVTWMVREAGMDAVQMVRDTALYWAGGGPNSTD